CSASSSETTLTTAASSCPRTTRATRSGATSRSAASPCSSPSTRTRGLAGMSNHEGQNPLAVPYREREKSVTMESMGSQGQAPVYGTELERDTELFTLNIGPHHPATHGVLRLLVTLEGEYVHELTPLIGYVHTGIEKSCEDQSYWK